MAITTAIWSSYIPVPQTAVASFSTESPSDLRESYIKVATATMSFAVVVVVLAPSTRLGKLGVPSTATNVSLPQTDSGLKNLNHDGAGEDTDAAGPCSQPNLNRPPSANRIPQPIKPRRSSLQGTNLMKNAWRRSSGGGKSFHLPRIRGSLTSTDAGELGLGLGAYISSDEDTRSQRTSTAAMAERVIWLVCEDCGASKRIVEPVGDPKRYFYDASFDGDNDATTGKISKIAINPRSPTSQDHEQEASVAGVGVAADRRRFALVKAPTTEERVTEAQKERPQR